VKKTKRLGKVTYRVARYHPSWTKGDAGVWGEKRFAIKRWSKGPFQVTIKDCLKRAMTVLTCPSRYRVLWGAGLWAEAFGYLSLKKKKMFRKKRSLGVKEGAT